MRKLPLITLVALAALVVFAGCRGAKKAEAPGERGTARDATPVSVALVQQRDLEETLEVTGSLKSVSEVVVGPRFAGKVTYIVGKSGTPVKKGQVVARLDAADAQIQLRAAQAAVRAAEARLAQAKAAFVQQQTATDSGILSAKAALTAAEARHKQAMTSADAQDATAKAQVAQAAQGLNAAKSRLAALQNGSRAQEKLIAENSVRVAEAAYTNDLQTFTRYKELYENGGAARAILDNAEAKMQMSKAQLESAKQQLDLVKTGPRQEDIDAAKAAVEQAQATLDSAKAGLKQVEVAQDNVEIARTGVEQAKAALQSAQAAVNINTMRDKDVLAAQEALQQARESRNTAEQMLDYMNIYSPVNGVVQDVVAEVGQSVGAAATVLRISSDAALFFEAQLSELVAPNLRAGQPVHLTVDALEGQRDNVYRQAPAKVIVGVVERVVPVVDARSRNFTVRIVVADTPALFPGMFARGKVIVQRHPLAMAIPKSALIEKDGERYVFVAGSDGQASRRIVTLGASDGSYLQVISGVQVGEQVITNGQQSLLDGDPITITQDANPS